MSRYLEILAQQNPFTFNLDENKRALFSVNFRALAVAPVDEWEEEIVKLLSDAGVATLGTDTFIGPLAVIPTGDGPYTTVLDTGGVEPDETHNGTIYERLSAQLVVRAKDFKVGRTRALAVRRALHGVRNTTVTA